MLVNNKKSSLPRDVAYNKIVYTELAVLAMLLCAFIFDISILILVAFLAICGLILFSKKETSIYYLAFFTSFSSILVFRDRHMFFVLAGLFIIKSLTVIKGNTIALYVIMLAYSFLFMDFNEALTFAKLIGLILLILIPIFATYSERIDCGKLIRHYIFGYTIQTVIGYFVLHIPAMAKLFEHYDIIESGMKVTTRFFGIVYDPNFFALSNYVIVAYLLFAFKDLSVFRMVLTAFYVFSGFRTISKSYYLVIVVLLVVFFIKKINRPKQFLILSAMFIFAAGIFFAMSKAAGYNVIELVADRFVEGGSFADNTTGRVDIWKKYFGIFKNAGIKESVFGFGFNAEVKEAAHNTLFELLYHYGVIGVFLWIVYFMHCLNLFRRNTRKFENKSRMVLVTLIVGVSFLSAYTYEAFWIGVVLAFITFGTSGAAGEKKNEVQCNRINI